MKLSQSYKRFIFIFFIAVLAAPAKAVEQTPPPKTPFAHAQLLIKTAAGEVAFSIEVATEPDQQRYGLMHRETLPRDQGMLFLMPTDTVMVMWMEDTVVSLDMLFID